MRNQGVEDPSCVPVVDGAEQGVSCEGPELLSSTEMLGTSSALPRAVAYWQSVLPV